MDARDHQTPVELAARGQKLQLPPLHGRLFTSVRDLRTRLARYARYYNQQRLHSALGYQSPVDYERSAA